MKLRGVGSVFTLALIFLLTPYVGMAQAGLTDLEPGIQLYKNRDYQSAKTFLEAALKKRKRDPVAWHYLGLVFEALDDKSSAKKAHEKAAKLGEDLLVAQLKELTSSNRPEKLTAIFRIIDSAAASARSYVALSALWGVDSDEWANRVIALTDYADLLNPVADPSQKRLFFGKDVTTKARILSKDEPMYTDAARQNAIRGNVVLYLTLADDGAVRGVIPIKTLPFGLTEEAIRVARKIRFSPAQVSGRPVSLVVRIEYFFDIR